MTAWQLSTARGGSNTSCRTPMRRQDPAALPAVSIVRGGRCRASDLVKFNLFEGLVLHVASVSAGTQWLNS